MNYCDFFTRWQLCDDNYNECFVGKLFPFFKYQLPSTININIRIRRGMDGKSGCIHTILAQIAAIVAPIHMFSRHLGFRPSNHAQWQPKLLQKQSPDSPLWRCGDFGWGELKPFTCGLAHLPPSYLSTYPFAFFIHYFSSSFRPFILIHLLIINYIDWPKEPIPILFQLRLRHQIHKNAAARDQPYLATLQ